MVYEDVFLGGRIGGLDYAEQARLTISDAAEVTIAFPTDTKYIGALVNTDSQVAVKWSDEEGNDISADNSVRFPASGVHEFLIPPELHARAGTVYLHFRQVDSAASKFIRYAFI